MDDKKNDLNGDKGTKVISNNKIRTLSESHAKKNSGNINV